MKINKNDLRVFFKTLNWKLLLIIALTILLPSIYQTTRINFVGQIDDGSNYTIASQIQWLNIAYEIITEAIIVPMFFWLSNLKQKITDKCDIDNDIKSTYTSLTMIIFSIFLLFTIIIFSCLEPMVNNLNLSDIEKGKTIEYMRYQVWSIFLTSFSGYLLVSISVLKLNGYLWIGIIINIIYLISNLLLDLFLVSDNSFSINLEYKGLGISSIISGILYFIATLSYFMLKQSRLFTFKLQKTNIFTKKYIIQYFKGFALAGTETLVRNVVFSLMIIKMFDLIAEQGTYWVANGFIWGWLLLPISILSLFIKETYSTDIVFEDKNKDRRFKICFYLLLTFIFIIIWFCTIPAYKPFMKSVMNVNDPTDVLKIIKILLGFYVCFAFSQVLDSWFIVEGKIGTFLFQTLIVNLTVYPIYYICYKTGTWVPTLESISIMFGVGLLVDFIVDVILYFMIINKKKILSCANSIINREIEK